MPTSCCIKGCTNRHTKGCNLGFFRLPTETPRRNTWLRIIGDKVTNPSDSSRICGTHFTSGRPSQDPDNLDFVPTIFVSANGDPAASSNVSHLSQQHLHHQEQRLQNHVQHQRNHYIASQQEKSIQQEQLQQQRQLHEAAKHQQEQVMRQVNIRRRTASYEEDIADRDYSFHRVDRKLSEGNTHPSQYTNGNRKDGKMTNGSLQGQRSLPYPKFVQTPVTSSRLFFPGAIPRAELSPSDTTNGLSERTSNKLSEDMSSSSPRTSTTCTTLTIREHYINRTKRYNNALPPSSGVRESLTPQREVAEENHVLRKRIRYLDSVVDELRTQLSDQQRYIQQLQGLAEIKVSNGRSLSNSTVHYHRDYDGDDNDSATMIGRQHLPRAHSTQSF